MNFVTSLKQKSVGFYLVLLSTVLALLATVLYLIFGIGAQAFSGWNFALLVAGVVLGAILLFYEGYISDFLGIAGVACLTGGLGIFLSDSVCDFADFIVKIQLFGNMENAGFRVVIIVLIAVSLLAAIAGCFCNRVKER